MSLHLPHLDAVTRDYMLRELDEELANYPYLPASMSPSGLIRWPALLHEAVEQGDDSTLLASLLYDPALFNVTEPYSRSATGFKNVNHHQAAERLAVGEFNTAYVHGLAKRYLVENFRQVEVYRAASAKWEVAGCAKHEGLILLTQDVFDGHRLNYWVNPLRPANPNAVAVPFGPGCHHSIRLPEQVESRV